MSTLNDLSRRSFMASMAAAGLVSAQSKGKAVPVGVELYSVRDELKTDLMGTVRGVAKIGYEGVEFYSPYFDWKPDYAREVRKLLDELKIKCWSTHNGSKSFTSENLPHAIELNQILGSKYVVMASAGKVTSLDGWKGVAQTLNEAQQKLKAQGMSAGFHNHGVEFTPLEGKRPMEVLAAETEKDIALQLDVGTCVHAGSDPVAWINANPGRIKSLHLKDWAPGADKGYRVLFGEGAAPWKQIFEAAESKGGVGYYLIEQEGSALAPMETIERCLANYRKLRST